MSVDVHADLSYLWTYMIVRLSLLRKTILIPEYLAFMCVCVFVDGCISQFLALNCRLQIEQVNMDCAESDDGPLALAFLSLRFLSASQILFASIGRHLC